MRVDVGRLRAVLEYVTAQPEGWDQGTWLRLPDEALVDAEPGTDWTCGTTACLAGWTVLRAGYVPLHRPDRDYDTTVYITDPNAPNLVLNIRNTAMSLLRLTFAQGNELFSAENNLRDLWEFARVFTDGAIQVPPTVVVQPTFSFYPECEDEYRELANEF